jgi:hypothetical protein
MSAYWNRTSPLFRKYRERYSALVPSEGKAPTLGGEALRAVSRLYYDAFNNGWGNNTSGAWNYLSKHVPFEAEAKQALDSIREYTNTGGYAQADVRDYGPKLDSIVDGVMAFLDTEASKQPNPEDLFALQEPTLEDEEDDDEDEEDEDEVMRMRKKEDEVMKMRMRMKTSNN